MTYKEVEMEMEAKKAQGVEPEAAEAAGGAPAGKKAGATAAAVKDSAEVPANLRLILDVPLEISVELGKSKILVKELLKLGQGSVVELDKLVDEPMEILVNQKRIARGEVVVSNDRFGVRLTDIIDPMEMLERLK